MEILDDNTLYELDWFLGKGRDLETKAQQLSAVSHYTEIKHAIEIVKTNSFLAKCLDSYGSEKTYTGSQNSREQLFFVSFSMNTESNEKMWNSFADNHKGCKIDFYFKGTFAQAFITNKVYECLDNNRICVNNISGIRASDKPYIQSTIVVPYYEDSEQNLGSLSVEYKGFGTGEFTVLNRAGRCINEKYDYQDEVRVVLKVSSYDPIMMNTFRFIRLPINISNLSKMIITVGNRANSRNIDNLSAVAASYPFIEIMQE